MKFDSGGNHAWFNSTIPYYWPPLFAYLNTEVVNKHVLEDELHRDYNCRRAEPTQLWQRGTADG